MNMPSTFAAAVLALCSCLAPTAASASVDIGTILDKLKFTFMGSFEARNGRWGGFTDLIYIDLGETRLQTRDIVLDRRQVPAGVSGNVGSIALADRSASRRASLNHWDAIVGVGVGEPGRGITGGVGVGAPSVGVVDPGLNQPGVPGNVCGVARRSIPTLRASLLSHSLKDLS